MNETLKSIKNRTSVRKFLTKDIPDKVLLSIVEAGLQAPSARNLRPFKLHIIKSREALNYISSLSPAKKMLTEAPCAILVTGDINKQPVRCYLHQDCSAVTQNIMIAAHSLGIGSCWLGVSDGEEFQKKVHQYLALDNNLVIISIIALGYSAEKNSPKQNRENPDYYEFIE